MSRWRVLMRTLVVMAVLAATTVAGVAIYRDAAPEGTSTTGPSSAGADSGGPGVTEAATSPSSGRATPAPTPTPTPVEPTRKPPPPPVAKPGDTGLKVREVQQRLFQLAWWPELTTGDYDDATRDAVSGFQAKRGFEATGTVDAKTWKRLVEMTEQPTHDQLHNILHPGPALLASGADGDDVRALQARLEQIAWWSGDVTGSYGDTTTEAVRGFQAKREIPVTGEVDQRTMDRLLAMTHEPSHDEMYNIEPEPGGLDPACTVGRVLCIDKATNSLRWVIDGQVQKSFDVRFGAVGTPTREGTFAVQSKSRDHVSSLYDSAMPFAMFFSGGQAVHYSSDFAANGYSGASHGCVNVRDYDGIAWLFDQVAVGDRVVVYWS